MSIDTDAGSAETITYYLAGPITGGTLIRYTILGVNYTVSPGILTSNTTAILALLNDLNIGTWILDTGVYYCYNCTVSLFAFRIDTGSGNNDVSFVGVANDYIRDYPFSSMATMLETETAKVPLPLAALNYGTCPCSCDFDELVFSGDTESNLFESDITSFEFVKFLSADTYSLALYKNDSVTPITIDATVADVWGFNNARFTRYDGTIDTNYSGFYIYWYRVFALHGYGRYHIRGTYTLAGVSYTYESHCFVLMAFNLDVAKGTVKIECYQNGKVMNETVDNTGFNWYQSVRVRGKLFKQIPKLVKENYLNGDWQVTQIQDQFLDSYELELRPLPAQIANFICYNTGLSNKSLISDYNVSPEVYNRLNLFISEVTKFQTWAQNTNIRGTFLMEDREQNKIKRNYP